MTMTPSDDAARWRDIARTLLGEATLTSAEVAARAGYPLDGTRRMWRAIGLPPIPDDERAFAESDVEIMRSVPSSGYPARAATSALVRVASPSRARAMSRQRAASSLGVMVMA